MARTTDSRLAYADLLRTCSALAVVILHISAGWISETPVGSIDWTVLCTYDSLVRWCVPMFVMLSGMFLLDPKKSVTFRDIFFKYILRILIALLVWGTFYALLDYGRSGWQFTWAGVRGALHHVLWADTHYHLWFLYAIIGLYLLTPILRSFVKGASRGTFHWFFAVTFLFYSLLPTLQALFPNRMALPMAWANRLDIHLVLGYVGYFVAGYYLKTFDLGRLARLFVYLLGILGTVITVWGTPVLSVRAGTLVDTLLSYRAPNVVWMALAVFVLFRSIQGTAALRLGGIARISFGIFLVHDFFIMVLRWLDVSTLSFLPAVSVPVLSAAVFLCACAVAWILSKIPLLGRYLT